MGAERDVSALIFSARNYTINDTNY